MRGCPSGAGGSVAGQVPDQFAAYLPRPSHRSPWPPVCARRFDTTRADVPAFEDTSHEHPRAYARAVGLALRAHVGGDAAVDPLTPSRVRNPVFTGADLRARAQPPVYRLGSLREGLEAAGAWHSSSQTLRGGGNSESG